MIENVIYIYSKKLSFAAEDEKSPYEQSDEDISILWRDLSLMAMTTTTGNPRPPPREPSAHASTFNCILCLEDNLPSSSRFMPRKGRCCDHCSFICRQCIASYIVANVEQGKSLIWCPMSLRCRWTFDPISCRTLVTRQIFDRWCDLLCESSVRGYERCYCPNIDCRELIIDECRAQSAEKIRCPNCKRSCCFRCSTPWVRRHKCDDTYHLMQERKWMRCPGCKNYVERIEGCSSILCRCVVITCSSFKKNIYIYI